MAGETVLQVLKELGKTVQSKSYMWLYRMSGEAKHQIVYLEQYVLDGRLGISNNRALSSYRDNVQSAIY